MKEYQLNTKVSEEKKKKRHINTNFWKRVHFLNNSWRCIPIDKIKQLSGINYHIS